MKRIAVAFTGPSNSGKTTLIEKISRQLIANGNKVLVVKNDPKDKARFDVEGKDSYKFYATGADVIVTSPTRTTYFGHEKMEIEEIITLAKDFDYLLVEGLKYLTLPRIAIFRGTIDESYFEYSDAFAVDSTINTSALHHPILDLNNPEDVILWIETNGKKV